jgi:hypothetical protein
MANELIAIRGTVTPVGWQPPDDMTRVEWEQVGRSIQQADKMMGWVIGDWLANGERQWGEMYIEAMELTGLSVERLRQLKWVATSVQLSFRKDNLSITHHEQIAKFRDDPEKQSHWLQQAEVSGWSVRELREAIQESERPKYEPPTQPARRYEPLPLPKENPYRSLADIPKEEVDTFIPDREEEREIKQMTALMSQHSFSQPVIVEREERRASPALDRLKQAWRDASEADRGAFREWVGW